MVFKKRQLLSVGFIMDHWIINFNCNFLTRFNYHAERRSRCLYRWRIIYLLFSPVFDRLRGVSGVRIVDASVMPNVVNGNTMATSIMIGEKGADLIKEDWGFMLDTPGLRERVLLWYIKKYTGWSMQTLGITITLITRTCINFIRFDFDRLCQHGQQTNVSYDRQSMRNFHRNQCCFIPRSSKALQQHGLEWLSHKFAALQHRCSTITQIKLY